MLSFLGGIVVLMIMLYIGYCAYVWSVKRKLTSKLQESDLVKKFNQAVKKITDRNLEIIKEELLNILEEYRSIKCENFIETKNLLEKCKDSVKSQVILLLKQESELYDKVKSISVEAKAGKLSPEDEKYGALQLAELEKLREVKQRLLNSANSISDKISQVDSTINLFNYKYELKKSEIIIMIANAATIKNNISIDLKLNDLVTEFRTKARENEIRTEVTEKIYGTSPSPEKNTIDNYNESEYIEKLKNFTE